MSLTLSRCLIGTLGAMPAWVVAATLSIQVGDLSSAALADAVVYAVPVNGKAVARQPSAAIIDQVNKQFTPLVSVIQVGTPVSFPNKDNIRHQVYSFSPAKTFELKLYSGVPSQPVVFDKPGLVVMGCNIHDRMLAYVQVVDTPWFAKTGADGAARIEGLPAGDYQVHVWHYGAVDPAGAVRMVKIEGGAESTANPALKLNLELKPKGPA